MIHGVDVARDFPDIIARRARHGVDLVHQQLVQCRLRPLDLGGKNRFLADEGVEQQVGIRHGGCRAIESPQGEHGVIQGALGPNRKRKRWYRRQRGWHERPDGFAHGGALDIGAETFPLHKVI